MIEFNVKKITETPIDRYDAIDKLIERNFDVINALNIFKSILENNWNEYGEFHIKRINEYIEKFKKC